MNLRVTCVTLTLTLCGFVAEAQAAGFVSVDAAAQASGSTGRPILALAGRTG